MCKKQISVLSWTDALKQFPHLDNNTDFCAIITQICSNLNTIQKDYVYHAQFEFGEKLIDKGCFPIDEFKLENNNFRLTQKDFEEDFEYSKDPLGIVCDGFIEVYIENECDMNTYKVPLNVIKNGELFGLFGTLDKFAGIDNDIKNRDWFVTAGNISSLIVASPFHINSLNDVLDFNVKDFFKKDKIEIDKWIKFINHYKEDSWSVDIIYFPKRIIDLLKVEYSGILYKEGWKQSYSLRNVLLSDPAVTNKIEKITTKLNHEKIFLNSLYNYLLKVINNEAGIFVPLQDLNHYFFKALNNFKTNTEFNTDDIGCLPFNFDLLKDNNFGILPIHLLPVSNAYKIQSLNLLLNDLTKIDESLSVPEFQIMSHIRGFGNTGNVSGKEKNTGDKKRKSKVKWLVEERLIFKENFLKDTFDIELDKINLTSKEFSNLLIIVT